MNNILTHRTSRILLSLIVLGFFTSTLQAHADTVLRQLHSFSPHPLKYSAGLVVGKGNEIYGYRDAGTPSKDDFYVFHSKLGGVTNILAQLGDQSPEGITSIIVARDGSLLVIDGSIYDVALDGTVTPFTYTTTGPAAGPTTIFIGSDGNYYGASESGGEYNSGAIYEITSQSPHIQTILHTFTPNTNGGVDPINLIQAANGSFYGTTFLINSNNTDNRGLVFKLDATGNYTVLHQFRQNPAYYPFLWLQAADGTIYGTTSPNRLTDGSIFTIDQNDNYSSFYTFTGGTDGYGARDILQQPSTGNIYALGGEGGFIQLNPANQTITNLYTFAEPGPLSPDAIVTHPNGRIYGLSTYGGINDDGTLFSLDPNGTTTSLDEMLSEPAFQ